MLSFTIVTPSLNQVMFVDRMLNSISEQTYPLIEHIIFDAGSTDGTLQKLRSYASSRKNVQLSVGKDKSQSNAINLGFSAATGDIICWLNTDDYYCDPNVIADVAAEFERHPEVDIIYGRGDFLDQDGRFIRSAYINTDARSLKTKFATSVGILQPSLFMRRSVFEQVGPINETLHYCFDYEYWIRAARTNCAFRFLDRKVSNATLHMNSKTMGQRVTSLRETCEMVAQQFGFVAEQWVYRLADAELNGADGIVKFSPTKSTALKKRTSELMREFFAKPGTISAIRDFPAPEEIESTSKQLSEMFSQNHLVILTAFDSKFYASGLTLLARVFKFSPLPPAIIVYDLGMSDSERAVLSQLENVSVVDFPNNDPAFHTSYFTPQAYGFKSFALAKAKDYCRKGTKVLWLDAGIAPIKNLRPILECIDENDVFLVDHDDKSLWPFHNATFCSDACASVMRASNSELTAPHIRAGVIGYKVGGRFQLMIDEAFGYSLNPEALTGPKHLNPAERIPRSIDDRFRRMLTDADFRDSMDFSEIRQAFGYLGHRHDQTIVSILAARHKAPVMSATEFCIADDISSAVSKRNWEGTSSINASQFDVDTFYDKSQAVLMQHRGTFLNSQGLPFTGPTDRVAIILGNGPSLKGFDFSRLKSFDVFGMNAAYRYWDRIGWYPQYYSCLDTVLGLSHAQEIKRLIENAHIYGIRQFLLRDNLISQLDLSRNAERVINFDVIKPSSRILSAPTISTGSHSAAWAAWLGYKNICLLGIDANYVEILPAAKLGHGTQLEIVEGIQQNPNYFFDDYQQVGDKYNIPNPTRPIHLDSWREIAERLIDTECKVWNGNPASKVDAFPFCDFARLENEGVFKPDDKVHPVLNVDYLRDAAAHLDETAVVSNLLTERSGPQYVMLDVGAHFGTSAQYFHKLGWTIYCFEPDPSNRAKLVARFGKATNVTIDKRAVSDKPATGVSFFSSEESTGISGLSAFRETHKESARVDVTTVSDIIFERSLSRVDFLKIDVEGFDFGVLKGVPWDKLKPDVIECEFEDAKTVPLGHTWKDIADFLRGHGYHVYVSEWHPIIRYGIPHDWRRVFKYPGPHMDASAWGNFLAFREDPGMAAVQAAFDACVKFRVAPNAGAPQSEKTVSSPAKAESAKPAVKSGTSASPAANLNPVGSKAAEAALAPPAHVSRVNMLQKTPPQPVETPPAAGRMWYSAPAHRIRQVSPQLFTLLQFARRSFVHVIARPHLLLLLLAAAGAAAWVSMDPQFAASRGWILTGGGLALVVLGLLYVAAKAQAHAAALHIEAANLQAEVAALKAMNAQTQHLAVAEGNARTDAVSGRIAQLQSEIAIAKAANSKLAADLAARNTAMTAEIRKLAGPAASVAALKGEIEKLTQATAALPALKQEISELSANLATVSQHTNALDAERQKLASEIKGEVAKLSGAVAAVPQSMEPKIKAANDATEKLSADLTSVSQRITALDTERQKLASEIKGEVAKLSGALAAVPQALEPRIKAASEAAEKLSADLAAVSQRVADLDTERQKLASEIAGLVKQVEAGQVSDEALQKDLQSLEEKRAGLQTALTETSDRVKAAEGRLAAAEKWSRFDNAGWFQRFNRRLTKEHTDILDKEWRRRLSVPMAPATLGYMANRACEIEGRLEGRLATSIEDILLRSLVARAVKGNSVDVLEIGTLFGTGAAIMFDALDGHFEKIHFTLLDPLEGYYHGAQSDILTGQPVDEDVVRKNFSRAGMREDQYTLIKHLSTEPEAMELAAQRKYDVLVIDGDHSYAGVKTDFENYAGFVRVGGYIIFDDYDSADWPDVKAYVDSELGDHAFVAPVGASWRTSVFRVVKAPAKPGARSAARPKSSARSGKGQSDQ